MSTPTKAQIDLALQIKEALARSGNVAAAQLIADSEARATAELRGALALGQENCDDAYDELRGDADELRADVVRLTAERDELRSDCENETKWAAHYLAESIAVKAERDQLRAENATLRAAQKACEACDEPTAFEVRQLRARAERAEAIVGKLQELHGCSQEMVVHWCEHAANRSLGLDQARSELATEREKAERYRLATLKLDAELATERARLDWLESDAGVDWQWSSSALTIRRAVIDAAIKEDAK